MGRKQGMALEGAKLAKGKDLKFLFAGGLEIWEECGQQADGG